MSRMSDGGPSIRPRRVVGWALMVVGCLAAALIFLPQFRTLVVVLFAIAALMLVARESTWGSRWRALRELGVALLVLLGLQLLTLPVGMVWHFLVVKPRIMATSNCLANVKAMNAAMRMYLADNDGCFPQPGTWCDGLVSYLPGEETFVCPTEPALRCGYAFSDALGGTRESAIRDALHTVAVFESDVGWNAAGGPELLPVKARHFGGENYAFADGGCYWLVRERLPDGTWPKQPYAEVIWEPVLKESEGDAAAVGGE
jgi:hypothetical protein